MAATSGCILRNSLYSGTAPCRSPDCCFCMASCTSCCGDNCPCARPRKLGARAKTKRREGFRIPATCSVTRTSISVRQKPSGLFPLFFMYPVELEEELRSELDNTRALFLRRLTKVRVGLGDLLTERILRELQGQVAARRERPQRMIEEVVSLSP